jgi:RimJ/RimL family protein N-acetyltransferase
MSEPAPQISLRPLAHGDLPTLFEYQRHPEANRMAAFTPSDPHDRAAFDRHWQRLLDDPTISGRAIEVDGELAGSILLWRDPELDAPEVTYWLGHPFWGRGIATLALRALLDEIPTRPLYGRAASTNPASIRVLEKCGFRPVRVDRNVQATSAVVDEHVLRLDR